MRWRLTSTAFLGLAVVILALGMAAHAQTDANTVELDWTVEQSPEGGWTVGDRIPLRLMATYPAGIDVTLPEFPQDWDPFEVQEQSLSEVGANADGTRSIFRSATVTVWAPGEYLTPPVAVLYTNAGNQLHEAVAPRLPIRVVSVLENGENQKRDLKPQAKLSQPPLSPRLLGGLLLAAICGAVAWSLVPRARRRTVSSPPATGPREQRSPQEIAHSELDRISTLDLPARGELQRHYGLVADCVRKYAEGRYAISAMDQTTDELTSALHRAHVSPRHADLLHDLLSEADLVKFAQWRPSTAEAQTVVARARQIVDETKADRPSGQETEKSAHSNKGGQHLPSASRLTPDESPPTGRGSNIR